jgi:hypothetical protein
MKKSLTIFAFLIFAAILFSTQVMAEQKSITFLGGGPNVDILNRYYIDPYSALVNGAQTTVWCVDFNHHVSSGNSWTANVTTLDSFNTTNTYLKDVNAETKYQEMAYLIQQFNGQDLINKQAIQAVIWNLSTPNGDGYLSNPGTYFPNGQYSYWQNQAASNYATADFSGWEILSDVNGNGIGSKQEFLVRVPEPFTMIFLGSCLLGAGMVGRRFVV